MYYGGMIYVLEAKGEIYNDWRKRILSNTDTFIILIIKQPGDIIFPTFNYCWYCSTQKIILIIIGSQWYEVELDGDRCSIINPPS